MSMKRYVTLACALLLMAVLMTGCARGGAAVGDTVIVGYTGTLSDGTVFDTTEGRGPVSFVIGDGSMIAGFDAAVRGMEVGEIKTVVLPAAECYGEYQEGLVVVLPLDEFEEGLEVGDVVHLQNVTSGDVIPFTVVDISGDEVLLDANHPLAGQDLTFEIKLISIE